MSKWRDVSRVYHAHHEQTLMAYRQTLVLQMCCSVWYADTCVADVLQRMVYRHLWYADTYAQQTLVQTSDTSTKACVFTHVPIRVYRAKRYMFLKAHKAYMFLIDKSTLWHYMPVWKTLTTLCAMTHGAISKDKVYGDTRTEKGQTYAAHLFQTVPSPSTMNPDTQRDQKQTHIHTYTVKNTGLHT